MNTEAARRGINVRVYNSSNVAYYYAQMLKEHLEQNVKDAAARMAKSDGADKKSAKAPVPRQEGFASRKLLTPPSSPKVMERATQATGPLKHFEKYKGQKGKRSDKRGWGLSYKGGRNRLGWAQRRTFFSCASQLMISLQSGG
jgi:predicted Zn-dependent protease